MTPNPSSRAQRLLPRLKYAATQTMFRLGRRSARLVVFSICGLLLIYLLYRHVGQPLAQDVDLPPGVTESALQVDQDLLQKVTAQRVERLQAPRQDFSSAATLIAPAPRSASR